MASSNNNNNGPEDVYMKKIWKRLSKGKTMDNMRKALQDDEGYQKYQQEEIRREFKDIIDRTDMKTYEKLFSELGEIQYSETSDQDLESLIKQAVDLKLNSFPENVKEKIFKKWDKIVGEDHKKSQT